MKKIFVSVGVVALGAAAVHASDAGLAMGGDNSKPWSVGASLRGFYDDNYTTSPNDTKRDSFGLTASPYIAYKLPLDQTTLGFRYTYGASWYQDRADLNSENNAWDQSHEFELLLNHSFNERFTLDVTDSFVIAQEPALLNDVALPYRTEGNNIRNHGEITLNGTLTRQLSFVVGYQNSFYDYDNEGSGVPATDAFDPSLSGLLDRVEHEALFNLRWQALPRTVLVGGYNYKQVDYTSDEVVAPTILPVTYLDSKTRNSRSHIFYGGVDQNFTKELTLSLRLGAEMVEKYNAPAGDPNDEATSPWGTIGLTYNYAAGSSVQIGFTHKRNQTDVVQPDALGYITSDQQTSVIYGNINHRFTPKLSGRLSLQWQDSQFFGGANDGISENFLYGGVSCAYRFSQYLTGDLGYDFSQLTSDISGRDYDRNRIYLGVTAAY